MIGVDQKMVEKEVLTMPYVPAILRGMTIR